MRSQALQRPLDLAGRLATVNKVTRLDVVAEHQGRLFGLDILKDVACPIPADLLRMPQSLQMLQEPTDDITLRQDPHQVALGIDHRESPILKPRKKRHCSCQRIVCAHGLHPARHFLADWPIRLASLQGLDQTLDTDHADHSASLDDGQPGDSVDAQDLL